MKASLRASAWPEPCTSVLTVSLVSAFSAGIVTLGALPKPPDTDTDAVVEDGEEEPPHPASATAVSRGRAEMTAIRRMGRNLVVVGCVVIGGSPASLPAVRARALHPGDELLHPLVGGAERVLAQHRALGLVVELEVDPVD